MYAGISYRIASIVTITRSTYNFKGLTKNYIICCNGYNDRRLGRIDVTRITRALEAFRTYVDGEWDFRLDQGY